MAGVNSSFAVVRVEKILQMITFLEYGNTIDYIRSCVCIIQCLPNLESGPKGCGGRGRLTCMVRKFPSSGPPLHCDEILISTY